MQKVFITGINGWIGQKLCLRLLNTGYECIGIGTSSEITSALKNKNVVYKSINILNLEEHSNILNNVDIVIHLASAVHKIPKTEQEIDEFYNVNVKGTKILLDQAIKYKIKKFIFISTVSVMGESDEKALDENSICNPESVYGKTKLQAEEIVKKSKLESVILRLTTVYGEGDKGNVIKLINSIDKGQYKIIGSGKNKKSMVYIENVLDSIFHVLVNWEKAHNQAFIITDNNDYSIEEIANEISKNLNKKLPQMHIPVFFAYIVAILLNLVKFIFKIEAPLTVDRIKKLTSNTLYNSSKFKNTLDFTTKHDLTYGIKKEVDWYLKNKSV